MLKQRGEITIFIIIILLTILTILFFISRETNLFISRETNSFISRKTTPTPTTAPTSETTPTPSTPTPTPTSTFTPSPTPALKPTPTPTPSTPASGNTKEVKVWMLTYRPTGEYFTAIGDPAEFTKNTLLPTMNEASKYHGYSNPSAPSAIKYTLESTRVENNPPPQTSGQYDYGTLFSKYDLCNYTKQNDVKAVILWADGTGTYAGGFWESAITGNKGIPTNGGNLPYCPDKTIVVYGLNYTRGLAEAMESYGHHLERAFAYFQNEYYSWADRNSCGNVHNPPNSTFEYDRANTQSFQSDCRNWKPDGPGTKETLSCNTWRCDTAEWIKFWMQNAPGIGNTLVSTDGKKIPNWWVYIGDPDKCYNNPLQC